MLHQPGLAFAEATPLDAGDPDVAAAIEAFRATVIEIRERSARLFARLSASTTLSPDDRADEEAAIAELAEPIACRADRIGLPVDELFRLINADLASRRGDPSRPYGEHLRALLEESTRAYAAEHQIHREITRLQVNLKIAVNERLAADRACGGFVAGRGQR